MVEYLQIQPGHLPLSFSISFPLIVPKENDLLKIIIIHAVSVWQKLYENKNIYIGTVSILTQKIINHLCTVRR